MTDDVIKTTSTSTTSKLKDFGSKTLTTMQKVGKSLVFPIACMPAAALFLRIGSAIMVTGSMDGNSGEQALYWIGFILQAPGAAVFNNLPVIFAIGVGFGFSKDQRGEAALVAALSFFTIVLMVQTENSLTTLFYSDINTVEYQGKQYSELLYVIPTDANGLAISKPVWAINLGVFGGIAAGLFSANMYNRFSETRLHPALGFFSGRRFTPMVVLGGTALLAFPIAAIWPWLQYGLILMAQGMSAVPATSAGVYAFINRLLIPFGLHQVLNTYFWFQMPIVTSAEAVLSGGYVLAEGQQLYFLSSDGVMNPVLGDINAFMGGMNTVYVAGDITGVYTAGTAITTSEGTFTALTPDDGYLAMQAAHVGIYQTGFFPIMMFGLPAVGIAIAMAADKEHKKQVMTFMITAALVSFLTGITEPLEFSFMFLSPLLYFCYALLSGIVAGLTVLTGASFGFGFSAGMIDFGLSIQIASNLSVGFSSLMNGYMSIFSVLIVGVACMPAYYFMTYFIIKKGNLATPGRNGNVAGLSGSETIPSVKNGISGDPKKDKWYKMAEETIKLAGAKNIKNIDNCITRVRLTVGDNSHIDQAKAKAIGYIGVSKPGSGSVQLIIGAESEIIANHMRDLLPIELDRLANNYKPASETTKSSVSSKPKTTAKKSTTKKVVKPVAKVKAKSKAKK